MPAAPALAPGWRCVPGDRCLPQCAGPGRRRGGEDPREPPDYRSQGASAIALPPIAGPASSTLVVLAGSALEEFQRKSGQKLEATGRGKGRRKGQEKEGRSPGRASPNPPRAPGRGRSAGDRTEGSLPGAEPPCASSLRRSPPSSEAGAQTHPPATDLRPPRRSATPGALPRVPTLLRRIGTCPCACRHPDAARLPGRPFRSRRKEKIAPRSV